MRHPLLVLAAFAVAVLFDPVRGGANDVAEFYEDNCAVCHTIGGGAQAGPDLKGVTTRRDRDWLIRFMLDPEAFASDPEVVRMIKEADGQTMSATEGLTRELAAKILDLIERRSGVARARPAPAAVAAIPDAPFTPADVALGRDLFTGSSRLSAAGPACIACHESGDALEPGGGRLGPDLMQAHGRLGGRRGLTAWLASPPTPMMRALYRTAPLTREESLALAAFLEDAAARGIPPPSRLSTFTVSGLAGAAALLVLIGVVWGNRFRAVRRPLVHSMRGPGRVAPPRNAPGAHGGPR
jgi:mono/diheme cytochrome c family protein